MEAYRTEDEQVEQIKRWFRDNGRQTITAILLALIAVFSYRYWQDYRLLKREAASAEYQNLVAAVRKWEGDSKPESLATAKTMADTLKKDFASSAYAQFGALMKARLAVKENDLATAEAELYWVLDSEPDADIAAVAQVRLARVLRAKGDTDGALAIIEAAQPGVYQFLFEKVRGDVLLDKGDSAGARAAYEKAKQLETGLDKPINDPLLDIKLADLQPASADVKPGADIKPETPATDVAAPTE